MCVCAHVQVPWYNASRLKRQLLVMKRGQEGGSPRQNAELRWNAVRWNLSWCYPEAWICTRCFSNNFPISTTGGGVWPEVQPPHPQSGMGILCMPVCVCVVWFCSHAEWVYVWALGDTQGHCVYVWLCVCVCKCLCVSAVSGQCVFCVFCLQMCVSVCVCIWSYTGTLCIFCVLICPSVCNRGWVLIVG